MAVTRRCSVRNESASSHAPVVASAPHLHRADHRRPAVLGPPRSKLRTEPAWALVTSCEDRAMSCHCGRRRPPGRGWSRRLRVSSDSMLVRQRTLAVVAIAAAAMALGWSVSRASGPSSSTSSRPTISIDQRSNKADPAVVERAAPFVRAATGDRPSQSMPWEFLASLGLVATAVAVAWTRRREIDLWARTQLRLLRWTVALRAPPAS
jgi:hypothetical protein